MENRKWNCSLWVIEGSMESQNNSNSCSNKKGFSALESCKNVMKRLRSSSTVASQSTNVEKMITDYFNEPPLESPKLKFLKPLEYWKSHNQHFSVLAYIARKYLSSPPSSIASESLCTETGIIDSNRRRRLLVEKIEMLTFIKRNFIT